MATNPIPISAKELKNKNPKNLPQKADKFSKVGFWSYTSLQSLDKILESGFFFASNLAIMNDNNEKELHLNNSESVHALCFCNSNTEKIPMWYLYGDITGKGCALGVTPAKMRDWIRMIKEVYVVVEEDGEKKPDPKQALSVGKDVSLECGWVFYRKGQSEVFYRNKWYRLTKDDYKEFENDNFFIKDYPWEYEREFRILIKNKTGKNHDRLAIKIPEKIYPSLKLRLAPELTRESFQAEIKDLEVFQKLFSSNAKESDLGISMNLLSRNEERIHEYAKEHASDICKVIREASSCTRQSK